MLERENEDFQPGFEPYKIRRLESRVKTLLSTCWAMSCLFLCPLLKYPEDFLSLLLSPRVRVENGVAIYDVFVFLILCLFFNFVFVFPEYLVSEGKVALKVRKLSVSLQNCLRAR